MRVGVPTEIKPDEHRVAVTPSGVQELVDRGHEVVVQAGAGAGSGISDGEYEARGARIVCDARSVYGDAELIVKVKEPQPAEVELLGDGHTLFAYLHLAATRELTDSLLASGATCIAYETVEDSAGRLPLLAPMSEIAGRLAAQAAAAILQIDAGGLGILLGGACGVRPATVVVIGGGVVGANAAGVAAGMGARVVVVDRSVERLRDLRVELGSSCEVVYATTTAIEELLPEADVVIGAVLVNGGRAPHVVRRDQLRLMRRGAVLVDVSIDQGGCFETSRPTTHSAPTYEVDGIVHYCVTNLPGVVPATSTVALTNATLPYVLRLADCGTCEALSTDRGFLAGLAVVGGVLTAEPVAAALNLPHVRPEAVLDPGGENARGVASLADG